MDTKPLAAKLPRFASAERSSHQPLDDSRYNAYYRTMANAIARELKQKKRFASREQEVLLGLRTAAARVVEPWARFLKAEAQLTNNQYNVLRILRGSHPARLACSDVGERMIDRDPDITRLIDRLEKRGLVKRVRSDRDRRVVEVAITAKGLTVVRGLDAHVHRLPRALLGHLGARRLRQLGNLLEAVISELGTFP
jgi:DNA-binding MarR family transcriptional regulator